jgi:hypothetical protein
VPVAGAAIPPAAKEGIKALKDQRFSAGPTLIPRKHMFEKVILLKFAGFEVNINSTEFSAAGRPWRKLAGRA